MGSEHDTYKYRTVSCRQRLGTASRSRIKAPRLRSCWEWPGSPLKISTKQEEKRWNHSIFLSLEKSAPGEFKVDIRATFSVIATTWSGIASDEETPIYIVLSIGRRNDRQNLHEMATGNRVAPVTPSFRCLIQVFPREIPSKSHEKGSYSKMYGSSSRRAQKSRPQSLTQSRLLWSIISIKCTAASSDSIERVENRCAEQG